MGAHVYGGALGVSGSGADRRLPRALARRRLLDRLDGIYDRRLALVVAPAGCGKTTVITQWTSATGSPVAWYRADPADSSDGRLLERLAACVMAAIDDSTPTVTDHGDLVDIVERFGRPLVLVVDDLHLLADTTAEADLERFLLNAPPQVVLLVGSRRMPSFNLARSELADPITVSGEDLRFRSWEVEQLFRDVYASPLRPDDAAALTRHTEGWAAALQLFHASTSGRPPSDRRRAVSALATRSRFAQHYLSGQVLAELPSELSEFLLRTSVFDVVTAERCDELLGRNDSQSLLVDLERRQALISTDDDGASFRYHEVLRRHLESALHEELGADVARDLYTRAADMLEQRKAVPEAIRARCRAEDWDAVRRLLERNGDRLTDAGMTTWLDLLPPWLTDGDAWVALAEARRLLADGRLAAAQRAARRAQAEFSDPTVLEIARMVARSATTWLPGPLQPSPRWDTALRAATMRHPLRAVEIARALDSAFAPMVEAIALLLAGDYRHGEHALRHCGDDLDSNAHASLVARAVSASLAAVSDRGAASLSELDAVQVDAARLGLTWLARVVHGVVRATGATDDDLEAVEDMVADCEHRGDLWGAALIASVRAASGLSVGEPDLDLFEEVCERFRALEAGVLETWARAALALAAAATGSPDAATQARSAESMARLAEAPGALAITYAALAYSRDVTGRDASASELLDLAESTARSAGLRWRPWATLHAPDEDDDLVDAPVDIEEHDEVVIPDRVRVDLRLFGGFSISVEGVSPDIASVRPGARAALRLLALNAGSRMHRERIADLLYPELTQAKALHNLQVAISSLRSALQPKVSGRASKLLVRDGDSYVLALGPGSTSDLCQFDQLLGDARQARSTGQLDAAAGLLAQAIDLYRGDLLPEDGPAEWVSVARDNYRLRAAEASGWLAELELARGHSAEAVEAAIRSVAIDQWRDGSWRVLIAAHEKAGDVAAANRARRSYAEVLQSLGVKA